MSLNSVVNKLVRAAASVSQDISDADLDAHVARLLAAEAKANDAKWSELGLGAYLNSRDSPDAPDPSLPKTNKRFLASVIRTVDGHNQALLRQQAQAASDTRSQREPRRASGASRLFGGALANLGKDSRNTSRRDKREGRERDDQRERDRRRDRRSCSPAADRDRTRSHEERRYDSDDRITSSRKRSDRHSDDDRRRPDRYDSDHKRERSRDRHDERRKRRTRDDSDDDIGRDKRDRRDRRDRRDKKDTSRERSRERRREKDVNKEQRHRDRGSRRSQSRSRSPRGPPPPRDSPPPIPPSPPADRISRMDKYFHKGYDPRLDVGDVPRTGIVTDVGWDSMLSVLKDRGKIRKRNSPSLSSSPEPEKRDRVLSRPITSTALSAPSASTSKSLLDMEYTRKGGVREWDKGK